MHTYLLRGTITVPNTEAAGVTVNNTSKKEIFKNCPSFTNYITEINTTQIYEAQDVDIVTPMHNLIDYSDPYSKTSERLSHYYRDKPAHNNNNILGSPANDNNSTSFKIKQKITRQTGDSCTKDVEIMIPLKYLNNFWRTLQMLLINCEISLQLKLSNDCILVAGTAANQNPKFKITNTKLYVPIVTLSTQDNIKLFKQLEPSFKRTSNWN